VADMQMDPEGVAADPRLVVQFSNLGHLFTHLFTLLYATAVLHLPGVFGLPFGEMLGLSSLGLILYGVCALPAGWLADRYSQTGMMVLFFVGIGAGAVVTGLADTPADLWIGLTLIGAFASIYHPVGIAWLLAWARRQGMALGVNGVFGGLGSALAPLFVGAMIDHVSWRAAFLLPGAAALLAGGALALLWWRGTIRDAGADRAPAPAPEAGAAVRVFVILTLTMTAAGFVYGGLTSTMPKLFEDGLGLPFAGSYTAIGAVVGLVIGLASFSSVVGGWLAERYSARSIYLVCWALIIAPIAAMVGTKGITLVGLAAWTMFALSAFSAAENLLVARYTPFRWRSMAFGAKFVLALGVAGLTVRLAGNLYDRDGHFGQLYLLLAAAAAAAVVAALLLPRPQPQVAVSPSGP
jgi:FSR family fosmidomycin resistance protein-like MFS transporter